MKEKAIGKKCTYICTTRRGSGKMEKHNILWCDWKKLRLFAGKLFRRTRSVTSLFGICCTVCILFLFFAADLQLPPSRSFHAFGGCEYMSVLLPTHSWRRKKVSLNCQKYVDIFHDGIRKIIKRTLVPRASLGFISFNNELEKSGENSRTRILYESEEKSAAFLAQLTNVIRKTSCLGFTS